MGGMLPGPKGEILLSLAVSKDGRSQMSGPFMVTEKYAMSTLLNFLSGPGLLIPLRGGGDSVSDWATQSTDL